MIGCRPGGQTQAAGKFFTQDGMGVGTEHDLNLMLGRVEVIEQALRVQRAAGAGYSDKYSQGPRKFES